MELLDRQRSTIRSLLSSSVNLSPTAFSLEDVALNSITQVACTALYMYWTRDCEQVYTYFVNSSSLALATKCGFLPF